MQGTGFRRTVIFVAVMCFLSLTSMLPAVRAANIAQNHPLQSNDAQQYTVERGAALAADGSCGAVTETGPLGFPGVDLSTCNKPDDAPPPPRKPWKPITVGASACVDWTLYHSDQTGNWEIFRLGEIPGKPKASANVSKGTGPNIMNISPSRAPDGNYVAFTSNRDGNWEIYIGAADGTSQQRVTYNTTAADIAPMWSPNGKWIAYETTRFGSRDLMVFDVTTGEEKRLTDNPAQDVNPFWSADSSKLLFQTDRDGLWQIYELDIASGNAKHLGDGSANDLNPQYSPDGTKIAFRSYRNGGSKSVIYTMNADGTGLAVISKPEGDARDQVWSADSQMLAYDSDVDGNREIYVYQIASSETRRLTQNDVRDVAPTWRCNAPIIIFTSDIMGNANLFQTSALPMNNRPVKPEDINQITFDTSNAQFPSNSPAMEDASQRSTVFKVGK